MAQDAASPNKRFRVALSFSGNKRDYVAKVASLLADRFGEDAILYDKYHEAEFSHPHLAFKLPQLYHDQADLVVAVLCKDYENREWCGLEWNAIFDLTKKRKTEEVMLARFDYVEAKGLYSLAGYIELDRKNPEETTSLILQRLALNEGKPKNFYLEQPSLAKSPFSPPRDKTIDVLTQALTSHPRTYISDALPNVAKAIKIALEKQRPGREVKVELVDNVTKFTITPKEGVEPDTILITPPNKEEAARLQALIADGRPFELPESFQISPPDFLPRESTNTDLKFKFSFDPDNKFEAEIVFRSANNSTTSIHIPGECRLGHSMISFHGSMSRDLMTFTLEIPIREGTPSNKIAGSVLIGKCTEWEGKPLRYLPHFPKMEALSLLLKDPATEMSLLLQGHQLATFLPDPSRSANSADFISNIKLLVDLSIHLNINPLFSSERLSGIDFPTLSRIRTLYKNTKITESQEEDEIADLKLSSIDKTVFPTSGNHTFKAVHPATTTPFFEYVLSIPEISFLIPSQILSADPETGSIRFLIPKGSTVTSEMHGSLSISSKRETAPSSEQSDGMQ